MPGLATGNTTLNALPSGIDQRRALIGLDRRIGRRPTFTLGNRRDAFYPDVGDSSQTRATVGPSSICTSAMTASARLTGDRRIRWRPRGQ